MPDPTAFATREQLLTTQREVLAELERTWRLRRTVPATLWMVGVTFALLLVLAAVDAVGRRGASGVVVLVLVGVPALLLVWRGTLATWGAVTATRQEAEAAHRWRALDRSAAARALPPGRPGDLATAWDRRDAPDLERVARDRAADAHEALLRHNASGYLPLVVPFVIGLVGLLAVVVPGADRPAAVVIGGLVALLWCGVPAAILLRLVLREAYRRQIALNTRYEEGAALVARRQVLDGTGPRPGPEAPGVGRPGPGLYAVVCVGIAAVTTWSLRTGTPMAQRAIPVVLAVAAGLLWLAAWRSRRPRVRPLLAGTELRLGVGRPHRVEVVRDVDGSLRLRPRDPSVPEVVLPAETIRGVAPVRLSWALAPPACLVVTSTSADHAGASRDHEAGLWLLSGRRAVDVVQAAPSTDTGRT